MPSDTIVSPPSETIKKFEASLQIIKNRFCKLQWDLDLKESYIKYLENEILIRDGKLDPLRQEISNIKERLEKTLRDSESRENYIDYLEKWLVIFQDEIDKLNEKIKILILYKNGNDNIDRFEEETESRISNSSLLCNMA